MASTFSLLSMRGLGSALACAVLLAAPAAAQTPPAAPPAQRPAQPPAGQRPAQPAQRPAAAPPAAAAAQPAQAVDNWKKMCNEDPGTKKVFCVTENALRDQRGNIAGSIGVREFTGDNKRDLVVVLPPGVNLKYGVQVKMDDKDFAKGPYERCFPRGGCISTMDLTADNMTAVKKAQRLVVEFVAPDDKGYKMAFSLAGFKAAAEGEGTDLRKQAEEQKALQDGLAKRAAEASERLLKQGATPQ